MPCPQMARARQLRSGPRRCQQTAAAAEQRVKDAQQAYERKQTELNRKRQEAAEKAKYDLAVRQQDEVERANKALGARCVADC